VPNAEGGFYSGRGAIGAWGNHGGGERFVARRFLNDASFRDSLEANISANDKQTIEKDVEQIKSDIATLKSYRNEFKTARTTHDTATLHQLFSTARPIFQQIRTDRKAIMDLLRQYKNASVVQPVYPNPVRIGSTAATISYTLKTESNVTIAMTDASGRIVQEITNGVEGAGDHTVSIGPNLTKPGVYYVTIQTGSTKTTQKLVAVE
jgi:hypothetical protein